MYEDIMRRPMFQNAQQRAGSGIMAGVAPVQGFDNGGEAIAFEETYNPEFQRPSDMMDQLSEMREGEGILSRARKGYEDFNEEYDAFVPDIDFENFGSMEQTEGTGINTRDVTDMFFDYEDPLDYATVALIAFPPAYISARLIKYGLKGKKLAKQMDKVVKAQEFIPKTKGGLFLGGSSRAQTGLQTQVGGNLARESIDLLGTDEEEMADGGIAALPVQKFGIGGVALALFTDLAKVGKDQAYKLIDEAFRNKSIKLEDADELFEFVKNRVDDVPPGVPDDMVRVGEEYVRPIEADNIWTQAQKNAQEAKEPPLRKATDEDLGIGGKPPEAPDPISSGTKIDDVVDSAEAVSDSKLGRALTYPIRNPIKTTLGGAGVLGATDLATGSNYLSGTIDNIGNVASGVLDDLSKTGDQAEVSALGSFIKDSISKINPYSDDADDADDVGDTPDRELMGPPLPPGYLSPAEIVQQQRNQPKSDASTSVGKEDDKVKEERKKFLPRVRPFGGKIAKALLGEDEAFGSEDPANQGFLERTISKLQDPRTKYAIAKANQPSEGFATRNAMSDMVLGAQEYDDMIAKRGYLEAQTKDVDRTDTEKLVDYYMDSLKERGGYNDKELAKIKTDLNSLFFAQGQDAQTTSLFATIFDLVPNPEDAISVANKFLTGSQETRKSIQNILAGNKDT